MFIFFFSCLKNGIKADDRTVNWKQILLKLDSLLSEVNEFKKANNNFFSRGNRKEIRG